MKYAEYRGEHECRCHPVERGWRPAERVAPLLVPEPTLFGGSVDRWMELNALRDAWVAAYSWAVPTRMAIQRICDAVGTRTLLDPMCGTGYWASLLRAAGVVTIASDVAPGLNHWAAASHVDDAIAGDAVAMVESVNPGALLLVWPPYDEDVAQRALDTFRGDVFVYVGEGEGGCTATDAFHQALADEWDSLGTWNLPQWPGIHDYLAAFARRA